MLGANATEIAKRIGNLMEDRALRARIESGGFHTFNTKFTAKKVAGTVLSKMNAYLMSKGDSGRQLNAD